MPCDWSRTVGRTELHVVRGDIVRQATDAIVNAAHASLAGGGGVDGAIHRAAGPSVMRECQAFVRRNGRLGPGHATATKAGRLPSQYVIHAVGPVYTDEASSAPVLRSAYGESLSIAERLAVSTVSFPSISTGAYGYPVAAAARVAWGAIVDHVRSGTSLRLVQMVCFSDGDARVYGKALHVRTRPDNDA